MYRYQPQRGAHAHRAGQLGSGPGYRPAHPYRPPDSRSYRASNSAYSSATGFPYSAPPPPRYQGTSWSATIPVVSASPSLTSPGASYRARPSYFTPRTGNTFSYPPPPLGTREDLANYAPPTAASTALRSPTTAATPGTSSATTTGRTSAAPRSRGRCQICSFKQEDPEEKKAIYHDHFSSVQLRTILGIEDSLAGRYLCPSCKSHHSPYPNERTKIVISDSTLHNFFAPPVGTSKVLYKGDILHADYVTISGATLETLFQAFKLDYGKHNKAMDVYVVAGYNDLVKNYGREFILAIIRRFVEFVKKLPNDDNSENTVTIGPFLYPPQLAWFQDNGPEPPHYTNQKEKLDWLNAKIADLNIENGMGKYVGTHKFGMRVVTRKSKDRYGQIQHRHIRKHRWDHWREKEKQNMLHLTNERRFKLGKAVNDYFMWRTN